MELLALLAAVIIFLLLQPNLTDRINETVDRINKAQKPTTNPSTNSRPIRGNRLMSSVERNTYLQSPKWKALRQQVIERDKYCQLSGATTNLEVHHITYDNLGNEYLEDLVLLSRKAHQFTHDYYGSYDRNNAYPITESLKTAYAIHLLNNT